MFLPEQLSVKKKQFLCSFYLLSNSVQREQQFFTSYLSDEILKYRSIATANHSAVCTIETPPFGRGKVVPTLLPVEVTASRCYCQSDSRI